MCKPEYTEEVRKSNFKKSEERTSKDPKTGLLEVTESDFRNDENRTSNSSENGYPEVRNSNTNHNDHIQNNFSQTNISIPHHQDHPEMEERHNGYDEGRGQPDALEIKESWVTMLRRQTEYDCLLQDPAFTYHKGIVDGIINIVADILAFPSETIRINGRELPYEVVRDRLIRIDFTVLSYTVQKLSKVGSDIFSGTNYILTALYNALDTIDFNFQAEVNRS